MKKRNISGLFLKEPNPISNELERICFEDLPEDRQREILQTTPRDFVEELAFRLAKRLREIGDKYDISE